MGFELLHVSACEKNSQIPDQIFLRTVPAFCIDTYVERR